MIPGRANRVVLHGKDAIPAPLESPGSVAFEAVVGTLTVRPPQSLRSAFDKLASGQPISLSAIERTQVAEYGVQLQDVTALVRESEMRVAVANGASTETVNKMPMTTTHYRADQPVRMIRSFIAAPAGY